MTKGLEGYCLWNESSMSKMMRATHHLLENQEVVVVVSAVAILEEVPEVGIVEVVASEAAIVEIHEEVSEVAIEEALEEALEVAIEEATEVALEAATEEGSAEAAIEGAIEAAEEALIEILRTEREIISSIAKTNDIIST